METDIAALQNQLEQAREDQRVKNEEHEQQVLALAERSSTTEETLKKDIEQLRVFNADIGLEIERIKELLAQVLGQVVETKKAISEANPTEDQAPEAPPGAVPLPEEEDKLYEYGWSKKKANDCDEAIRAFDAFARKFPKAQYADNATYLMADCLRAKKDYPGSIRALQSIIQKYGKGDKVDDAYILMHDNFVSLGRCKDAVPFLETLLEEHPRSNRAGEARKKLNQTRRKCRTKGR